MKQSKTIASGLTKAKVWPAFGTEVFLVVENEMHIGLFCGASSYGDSVTLRMQDGTIEEHTLYSSDKLYLNKTEALDHSETSRIAELKRTIARFETSIIERQEELKEYQEELKSIVLKRGA